MSEYRNYLAARIISEEKAVTYKLLSRALKVHVNAAKEMLYDFHKQQNGKNPGTIHATYLIAGTKRKEASISPVEKMDGEDDYMQSSPFVGSSIPETEETGESGVLSITLTREEHLDATRSQYEEINSIHIYSLAPHPLKDLHILTDTDREIRTLTSNEDPLLLASTYGTIFNLHVRRRTAKRPPAPANVPASAPSKPVATAISKLNEVQKASNAKEPLPASTLEPTTQHLSAKDIFGKARGGSNLKRETSNLSAGTSSKESTPAPPPVPKREGSSIFKAFAKAKPKPEVEKEKDMKKEEEDEVMGGMSEDDDELEETYVPPEQPSRETLEEDLKKRRKREEDLRKMMDAGEDDEEKDEDVVTPADPEPEQKTDIDFATNEAKGEEKPSTASRRRARRRIMKKKTTTDDAGYLVTVQEPAWESYSEEEPGPKPKAKFGNGIPAAKAKKVAAKQGQGNIMSFFGKK